MKLPRQGTLNCSFLSYFRKTTNIVHYIRIVNNATDGVEIADSTGRELKAPPCESLMLLSVQYPFSFLLEISALFLEKPVPPPSGHLVWMVLILLRPP